MSIAKVVEALTAAIDKYGAAPESITVDNGSEFTGRALEAWAMAAGVQLNFTRPGRPWRTATSKALMVAYATNV